MGSGSSSRNTVSSDGRDTGSRSINAGSVEGRGSGSRSINAGLVEARGSGSRSINAGSAEAVSRSINAGLVEARGSGSRSINAGSAEAVSRSINAGSVEGRGSGSRSINAGSDEGRGSGSGSLNTVSSEGRDSGSRSINSGFDEIYQNSCDVCLTQKMASEAKSYCTVCNQHLCQRCEQAHRGSKSSRSHTILTGSSIPSWSTNSNQAVSTMFCESLLEMTVKDKQEQIALESDRVYGCTFMPDGHLVVACGSDIKLFDRNFNYQSELSIKSFDVAVENDTDVIVSGNNNLHHVQVLPTMALKITILMDRVCFGVDVFDGVVYTTMHDQPGNGEVRVWNSPQRRLGVHDGTYEFEAPYQVKVSNDGSKVFVSDFGTDIVTCLNQQGHVIYRYSDRDLKSPWGMYVDGEDNLLVCGVNSKNVHVVRHSGKHEKMLLSQTDGLECPFGILYRQSDGCLAIVMGTGRDRTKLVVFTTKITKL